MRICELHQKYPGQHFPNCDCAGAVICEFHLKYPNQWKPDCGCGKEEKKARLEGQTIKPVERVAKMLQHGIISKGIKTGSRNRAEKVK